MENFFDITKPKATSNRYNLPSVSTATQTSTPAYIPQAQPAPAPVVAKPVAAPVVPPPVQKTSTGNRYDSSAYGPVAPAKTSIPTTLGYDSPFSLNVLPSISGAGADTTGGIIYNTVAGLPDAALKVAKDTAQGIARDFVGTGMSIGNAINRALGRDIVTSYAPTNPVAKAIVGDEPVNDLATRVVNAENAIKNNPIAQKLGLDKHATLIAFPAVVGSVGLDFTGWGGPEKAALSSTEKVIPEAFFKYMAKETDPAVIEGTLKTIGADEITAKSLAPHFAAAKTPQEAKDVVDVFEKARMAGDAAPAAESSASSQSPSASLPQIAAPAEKAVQPSLFNQPAPIAEAAQSSIFPSVKTPEVSPTSEATPLETAQQSLSKAESTGPSGGDSLPAIIDKTPTPVNEKVNALDYLRTPQNVLNKIGLGENGIELKNSYDGYLKEVKQNVDQITKWSKELPPESGQRLFQWLDGDKKIQLTPAEQTVGTQIKAWLGEFADRLNIPKDERLTDYITHIFPPGKGGEINEELAKTISGRIPGSVYDPFLLQRTGAKGYVENAWRALDAYVKTATRKIHMDPALDKLKSAANGLELSQLNYVKRYADRINMRPTELDTLIDNGIKSVVGYRFGVRPTKNLTSSARQIVSRAKLGLSFTSAAKNLTQGINTFAELGTKYTTLGYINLLKNGGKELKENGVMLDQFINYRNYSAIKKFWEKADKGIFANFEATELINRGAAYYGAKAKALAEGKSEAEAIQYGKDTAAKTQFQFGTIDTPVAMSSDIVKTLTQFQNYSTKQIEFLAEKVKNKEYRSLIRYLGAAAVVFGTIGGAFGMSLWDLLPSLRFGTPPSADLPVRAYKDITGAKDQYGKTPSGASRLRDFGNAALTDLVPGGTQINRTFQGLSAVGQGKSTTAAGNFQYKIDQTPANYVRAALFGKNNLPEAQKYYNKTTKKPTTTNRYDSI